jgi:hypothetical protein
MTRDRALERPAPALTIGAQAKVVNQDVPATWDRYKRSMHSSEFAQDRMIKFSWLRDADHWLHRHCQAIEIEAAERYPIAWSERNPLDHSAKGLVERRLRKATRF